MQLLFEYSQRRPDLFAHYSENVDIFHTLGIFVDTLVSRITGVIFFMFLDHINLSFSLKLATKSASCRQFAPNKNLHIRKPDI
jgi:hypothetical protein